MTGASTAASRYASTTAPATRPTGSAASPADTRDADDSARAPCRRIRYSTWSYERVPSAVFTTTLGFAFSRSTTSGGTSWTISCLLLQHAKGIREQYAARARGTFEEAPAPPQDRSAGWIARRSGVRQQPGPAHHRPDGQPLHQERKVTMPNAPATTASRPGVAGSRPSASAIATPPRRPPHDRTGRHAPGSRRVRVCQTATHP